MLHKLKLDLAQHPVTYLLFAVLIGGTFVVMVCGLFVLARLIAPNVQSASTPSPTLIPWPTIALTPAPADAYHCDQPPMQPVQPTTVKPASITDTQISAPVGRVGDPLPFLELPFPYDGGNENFGGTDAQFRQAVQRTGAGGRLNSFFDHLWPLYPSPKANWIRGLEPFESPAGGSLLLYDGTVSDHDYYSGHPGYDFMPFVRRTPTTPLFAAADGQVFDVGTSGSKSAHYVKLKHHVVGIGDFLTIYWHLHPDQYFDAMRGRIGQPIHAGERIGTMGNTGWSTGHHLHFEVIFDRNVDGRFTADERVDPFGFAPNAAYPIDPWGATQDFIAANGRPYHHTPSLSWYLWVHPLGSSARVPTTGGGRINFSTGLGGGEIAEAAACALPGSLPPNGLVNWSQSPDPLPTGSMAGTGHSAALAAFDQADRAVTRFDPPLLIELPFEATDLKNVDPNTLIIYRAETNTDHWMPLPTQVDRARRVAAALTDRPGRFSLMGQPLRDLVAPQTIIDVSGPTASDGTFCASTAVSLQADDASGLKQIEYSLDGGSTWLLYTASFVIEPNGVPTSTLLADEFAEGYGGPGQFVILASAIDQAGNVEEPPAFRGLVIDPSSCVTPTPTPTPTRTRRPVTRTFTPTPTRTPTLTPTPRVVFYASPPTVVVYGYCTTLYWEVDNVKSIRLDGEPVGGRGSRQVCPSMQTTYVLRVKFRDDTVREYSITVSEQTHAQPAVTFYAVPASITPPDCSTLHWEVDNVKSVRLDGEGVNGHGTRTVCPTATTTYHLRVKFNDDSIAEYPATITVNAYTDQTPPPSPLPLSPIDNEAIESSVTLAWAAVSDPSGIDRYEWVLEEERISPTIGFVIVESGSTSAQTVAPVAYIQNHVRYRWRVRAVDGANNIGPYSTYTIFRGTVN